jgi:hypothetical protein
LVGAVLHGTASAQQRDTARTKRDTVRSPRDTLPISRDSAAKRDTTREFRVPVPPREDSLLRRDSLVQRDSARSAVSAVARDSIKAPMASAEAPMLADPGGSFVWDRRDLFSTGALTVQDLLDRVPGLTGFRSGWIAEPMFASFLGDPGRVRVFLDGLELEEIDPRMRRIWDLTQIPLWALDDLRIERSASEIRIHLRSWRVDRTTSYTRTDVYTGDQATNLYRGLFGRRYRHGEALQFAGQQYGTDPGRLAESSDQLGILARVGWARVGWSADAFLLRGDRHRGRTLSALQDTIPDTESTRTEAYVRVGWGNTDRGPWVQALANASKYAFGGTTSSFPLGTTPTPGADTSRSRAQYVLAGGYVVGPFRASLTQRFLVGSGRRTATPAARIGVETKFFTVAAFGEGRGVDSTRRLEVAAVARPFSFVFVAGAIAEERPEASPPTRFVRGEAGIRLRDLWLSGGVLRRDSVRADAPTIFRRTTSSFIEPSAEGVFATVRGRIWKALYAEAQGIQWNDTGSYYRPRHQTRSELYISTSLLDKFPSGNFHLLASAVHEYRSSTLWPDTEGPIRVLGYRTVSTLLQVRILSAEVFWNLRNILGERYSHIPGYAAPRITNIYGVRWEFWN